MNEFTGIAADGSRGETERTFSQVNRSTKRVGGSGGRGLPGVLNVWFFSSESSFTSLHRSAFGCRRSPIDVFAMLHNSFSLSGDDNRERGVGLGRGND